jgi:hypothetical protein
MQNYRMSQVSFAIKATLHGIPLALATTIAVAALRPASAASAGPSPSTAQAAASAPGAAPEVEPPLDEIVVEAAVPGAVIGDIPPELFWLSGYHRGSD